MQLSQGPRLRRRFAAALFCATLASAVGPARAADPVRGADVYNRYCIGCHGVNGISVVPNAPNFARKESLMQPDFNLLSSIKAGKNTMPAFFGILSDNDIYNVIAYLRTLK